jgi:DNA-binding MurR/RpiR family transcriptional regulator
MTSPNRNSPPILSNPGEGAAEKRKGNGALVGALDRLKALRANLPPTAARIADFIVAHAAEVVHMSVTEVAERAGASEGSVIALCQQLGARGFQQVKIALARDLVQPVQFIHEDLARTDDTGTVSRRSSAAISRPCTTP